MSVSISNVQLKKAVTKAVEDFRNEQSQWTADYCAPRIVVPNKTGYLPRFGRLNQKNVSGKVSPFAPSPGVDYDINSTAFECEVYRRVANLPWELEVFDNTGLLSVTALALKVAEALQIERELELATLLVDTTNSVTAQAAPGTRWDDTGGDPVAAINEAVGTVDDNSNRIPEHGLCTRDVGLFLRKFVANKRASGGSVSYAGMDEVANYLGLKELRIMRAGYDSAAPGDAAVGAKVIAANKFWVFHKPQLMNMFTPSWASTPTISKLNTTDVYDINDPKGKGIRVGDCRDLVVADKGACVYIATPLT